MPALAAGTHAPGISLPLLNSGNGNPQDFSLTQARVRGPVLAAFFKVSCPVCQLAFPYLQRMHAAYGDKKVALIGISQDSAADTRNFAAKFGVKFPIALDELKKYPASNAYGLTNVPSLFWITREGAIEFSSVGWSKAEFEMLNQKFAAAAGLTAQPLFKTSDNAPEFKPG